MEKEEKKTSFKINIWQVLAIVFLAAFLISLYFNFTGGFVFIFQNPQEIGKKAVDYINEKLVRPGVVVNLKDVKYDSNLRLYNVTIEYQGTEDFVYVSANGKYLILAIYDLSEQIKRTSRPTSQERKTLMTVGNFIVSDDEVCKEDGKPIVYFFGASWCPHCRWEKPIIENVTSKFKDYISFHNNIDSDRDREIFYKYSNGGIPTIVIGCKYYRVGSGEMLGKEEETKALTALICKLTGNNPIDVCAPLQDLIERIP